MEIPTTPSKRWSLFQVDPYSGFHSSSCEIVWYNHNFFFSFDHLTLPRKKLQTLLTCTVTELEHAPTGCYCASNPYLPNIRERKENEPDCVRMIKWSWILHSGSGYKERKCTPPGDALQPFTYYQLLPWCAQMYTFALQERSVCQMMLYKS